MPASKKQKTTKDTRLEALRLAILRGDTVDQTLEAAKAYATFILNGRTPRAANFRRAA